MTSCRMLTLIMQLEVVFVRFLHCQIIIFPFYTILLKKVTLHSSYIRCGHWSLLTEGLNIYLCVHAKSLQSCPTPCNLMDCSLTGSSVHRIPQARIREWVAMPSSRGSSWPRDRTWGSRTADRFFTVWATREAHPSRSTQFCWDQEGNSWSSLPSGRLGAGYGVVGSDIIEWLTVSQKGQGKGQEGSKEEEISPESRIQPYTKRLGVWMFQAEGQPVQKSRKQHGNGLGSGRFDRCPQALPPLCLSRPLSW